MRTYIIYHTKGRSQEGPVVARFVDNPDFSGDWHSRYWPGINSDNVTAMAIDGKSLGLWFNEELVNIDGMWFTIFAKKGTSKAHIERVKRAIRNERDVVKFTVVTYEHGIPKLHVESDTCPRCGRTETHQVNEEQWSHSEPGIRYLFFECSCGYKWTERSRLTFEGVRLEDDTYLAAEDGELQPEPKPKGKG